MFIIILLKAIGVILKFGILIFVKISSKLPIRKSKLLELNQSFMCGGNGRVSKVPFSK